MKISFAFILISCFVSFSNSTNYEKWYYEYRAGITPNFSCITLENIGDTLINDKTMEILEHRDFHVSFFGDSGMGLYPDLYVYSTDDKDYIFENDKFYLIHDFSAKQGDSVNYYFKNDNDWIETKVHIDSTWLLNLDGKNYRAYVYNNNLEVFYRGKWKCMVSSSPTVIEKIGGNDFFVQQLINCNIVDYHIGIFRCFETDEKIIKSNMLNFAYRPEYETCDTVIRDANWTFLKNHSAQQIKIYPNPVQNIIYISDINQYFNSNYYIYDIQGKLMYSNFLFTNQIDVSNLNSGTYLIKIVKETEVFIAKFVKNE
jgi:hypothetical protein